jgi:hypothetical protein
VVITLSYILPLHAGMAPRLVPPSSWGQDYDNPDPLQLASGSNGPARSRSPVRHVAAPREPLLPVGPYVVPGRMANPSLPDSMLFEAKVPEGIHGPGKKQPAKLYIELLQDASIMWAAVLCQLFWVLLLASSLLSARLGFVRIASKQMQGASI